ncbi:MAG: proton-conducting transporter membrane subunit [Actinomycetota bacterium]|nr:proton-conducting transporter membrane subunit [Actinomycetota bacterium]
MSYYWSLLGPLALSVAVTRTHNNADGRWHKWIAIWVTVDAIAVMAIIQHGLFLGEWRAIFIAITNFVALTSAWDSIPWLKEHGSVNPTRYYFLWALFWGSLLAISLSQNLALSWLAMEFSTLASAALIVEMGDRHSLEAAWKYVVIASVGLIMALIGIVFIYASLRFQGLLWTTLDYSNLQNHYQSIAPVVRELATVFIVSGFGTKAGLVPFHTWLPDAHSEAPSPVSGLLSGILLGLSLFTIARFVGAVPVAAGDALSGSHLLIFFGTVSIVIGSLALLVQHDVKRLLAYSSIEQVGIMALALGMGTPAALTAGLLQFVFHATIKSSLFYGAGHLSVRYDTKRIDGITDLASGSQARSVFWALGILALAGLPPLGLAYSEWLIISQLWIQHSYIVAFLTSGSLTLTFAALTHHLIQNLWGPASPSPRTHPTSQQRAVGGVV